MTPPNDPFSQQSASVCPHVAIVPSSCTGAYATVAITQWQCVAKSTTCRQAPGASSMDIRMCRHRVPSRHQGAGDVV